ncbi:SHOCT domain-containing protein [Microbacterium invictum]|uniref:Cardiolipin synthase N-terminal domain-containing protein n=1 Tax=Microbacterium invictum TaxID=515415 RepID=A0AA40VM21_9MICO|nr:SHOCT domain-containing protein [Microbacterium invictum]MBB4139219.1 hypothetical protein [Microbacterium invictum]
MIGDLFWFTLTAIYFVSYIFVLFFIIFDLFRDDSVSGWGKAAWIVALLIATILTAIVYLIARGSGMAARANPGRARAPEEDSYRPVASSTPAADIATAKELLDAGTISQGEFDALKSKALGNQYFGA